MCTIKKLKWFITILLVIFTNGNAFAQNEKAPQHSFNIDSILQKTDARVNTSAADSVMKKLAVLSKEDSALKKAISEYNLFGLAHRKSSLQWNLNSSIIIFWTVIFLVLSGIAFAGIQFYIAMQAAKKTGVVKPEETATQVEATVQGIKVSSPVLGVIILIISMLFFYLYLKYVYPVTEIF